MSHKATSFPMGAMPLSAMRAAVEIDLAPGDWLVLLTDGIYEYEDPGGTQFGVQRVEQVLREHHLRARRGAGRPAVGGSEDLCPRGSPGRRRHDGAGQA